MDRAETSESIKVKEAEPVEPNAPKIVVEDKPADLPAKLEPEREPEQERGGATLSTTDARHRYGFSTPAFNILDICALVAITFCLLIARCGDIAVPHSTWFDIEPYFEYFCFGIYYIFVSSYVHETTARLEVIEGNQPKNWLKKQTQRLGRHSALPAAGLFFSAAAYVIWAMNGSPRLISSDLVMPDLGPLSLLVLLTFAAFKLINIVSLPARCKALAQYKTEDSPASYGRVVDTVAMLASAMAIIPGVVFTVSIALQHSLSALVTGHPTILLNFTSVTALAFISLRNLILHTTIRQKLLRHWDLVPTATESGGGENEEIQIKYNHFTNVSRWFKQKFALNSKWKLALIAGLVAFALLCNAPLLLAWFVAWVLTSIGKVTEDTIDPTGMHTLAGHATATLNIQMLIFYILVATLTGLFALITFIVAPKRIAANRKGLRVIYSKLSGLSDETVDWKDIKQIKTFRPKNRTNALEDLIIFEREDGHHTVKIKLTGITTQKDRAALLSAIDKFAPEVSRDSNIEETLRRPMENNYTELWLQALAAPPRREKLKPLVAGAVLNDDRYLIKSQIGVGGQGFAYLAQDKATEKDVVLKESVLPIYVDIKARKKALESFEKEAKLLSRLNHPQVVKLEGFFVEDHRAYLVLEHIDGINLRQLVQANGPLPEPRLRELALQMCTILEYLHGLAPPLVHRDFTPDNLILRKDGTLKLIDFNVAQQLDFSMDCATTGTVVGKQAYLPPEQFRGQAIAASDLYALGATLYFLAAGQDPLPISVSKPNEDGLQLSPELNYIVESLTQMEPSGRPASAAEVKRSLTT